MLVVKSLCQKKEVVYESYVNDDMTLEDTLQVATTEIKEVILYEKRFIVEKLFFFNTPNPPSLPCNSNN